MRVQDELLGHSRIESGVSLGCIAERNDRSIDDLGDGQTIMQDSLHQLPVVFQNRGLTCIETVRLCPSKTETHLQVARLASVVLGARILGDVKAGDADTAGDFEGCSLSLRDKPGQADQVVGSAAEDEQPVYLFQS